MNVTRKHQRILSHGSFRPVHSRFCKGNYSANPVATSVGAAIIYFIFHFCMKPIRLGNWISIAANISSNRAKVWILQECDFGKEVSDPFIQDFAKETTLRILLLLLLELRSSISFSIFA